jgi:5-methylcytosine-specific restriction endonuclease McrA
MGYRETYFKNAESFNGKYRCCKCGGWFDKKDIDVDHRIPKKLGGTDHISNLQAMCYHCNRSKGSNVTGAEVASTLVKSAMAGELGNTLKSAAVQNVKNALGFKYKRR